MVPGNGLARRGILRVDLVDGLHDATRSPSSHPVAPCCCVGIGLRLPMAQPPAESSRSPGINRLTRPSSLRIEIGDSEGSRRRIQSSESLPRPAEPSLAVWREKAKAQADAQLRMLIASPSVAAAAAAGFGSRETNAAARLLTSEQREALLKLRRLCYKFLGEEEPEPERRNSGSSERGSPAFFRTSDLTRDARTSRQGSGSPAAQA